MSQLKLKDIPLAQATAFADIYKSNGDISALPIDAALAKAELKLRAGRVMDLMRSQFGLRNVDSVVEHIIEYENMLGSLHTPSKAAACVVLRPPEWQCTRPECKAVALKVLVEKGVGGKPGFECQLSDCNVRCLEEGGVCHASRPARLHAF